MSCLIRIVYLKVEARIPRRDPGSEPCERFRLEWIGQQTAQKAWLSPNAPVAQWIEQRFSTRKRRFSGLFKPFLHFARCSLHRRNMRCVVHADIARSRGLRGRA